MNTMQSRSTYRILIIAYFMVHSAKTSDWWGSCGNVLYDRLIITIVRWLVTFVGVVAVCATVTPASAVVTATSIARPAARCRGRRAHDASEASPEVRFWRFSRNWLGTERVSTGSHNRVDHVVVAGGQEMDTVFCHHELMCGNPTVNVWRRSAVGDATRVNHSAVQQT